MLIGQSYVVPRFDQCQDDGSTDATAAPPSPLPLWEQISSWHPSRRRGASQDSTGFRICKGKEGRAAVTRGAQPMRWQIDVSARAIDSLPFFPETHFHKRPSGVFIHRSLQLQAFPPPGVVPPTVLSMRAPSKKQDGDANHPFFER